MTYDSATDTALAGQAYQRALATAAQRRSQLQSQYGVNADGSLDSSDAGRLGSVYQTGLSGEQAQESATLADRRRGFGSTAGLGGKLTARARSGALDGQARVLQGATSDLGGVSQQEQFAGQDYQNDLSSIASKSAYDLAQTLASNPIYSAASPSIANPSQPLDPAIAAAQRKALAANPRAAQVAKNNRF